jgi:hypothetical protein
MASNQCTLACSPLAADCNGGCCDLSYQPGTQIQPICFSTCPMDARSGSTCLTSGSNLTCGCSDHAGDTSHTSSDCVNSTYGPYCVGRTCGCYQSADCNGGTCNTTTNQCQ